MIKILVPVDGSESSLRMIDYLIGWLGRLKGPGIIHLINVQPALNRDVGMFISGDQMREFHRDEGTKALQAGRDKLDAAGLDYKFHIGVGDPAEVIAQFARDNECDQIAMGTRGLGNLASFLHSSVTAKVLQLSDVPVLLIK